MDAYTLLAAQENAAAIKFGAMLIAAAIVLATMIVKIFKK